MTRSRTYRAIFLAANPGPLWKCTGCEEWMNILEIVHHVDEDRSNNDLSNLEPMHRACHVSHHSGKTVRSEAWRRAISIAKTGVKQTPEHVAANREAHIGVRHSDAARAKMSKQRRGRPSPANVKTTCSGCGREFTKGWLTRHLNAGKCVPC